MRRNSFSNNNSSSLDVLPSKDYTKYAQAKLTKNKPIFIKKQRTGFISSSEKEQRSKYNSCQNTYSLIWNIIKNYLSKHSKQWDNLSSTVKKQFVAIQFNLSLMTSNSGTF